MVQNIEGFRTKLQLHRLAQANVLTQGEIKPRGRGAIDSAPASVSDDVANAGGSDGRVGRETSGVEVLLDRVRRVGIRIAQDIRPAAGD